MVPSLFWKTMNKEFTQQLLNTKHNFRLGILKQNGYLYFGLLRFLIKKFLDKTSHEKDLSYKL